MNPLAIRPSSAPGTPGDSKEMQLKPAHLRLRQEDQITHGNTCAEPTMNQAIARSERVLTVREPDQKPRAD